MISLLPFLLLSILCDAKSRIEKIQWDLTATATKYNIYLGIDKIAESDTNSATIILPYRECSVTVSAVNETGESPQSNPCFIPSVLDYVSCKIQFSKQLADWSYNMTQETRFARIEKTLIK